MRLTATTIASQVRQGSLSAGEVVEEALAAALTANERIGVFTSIDIEGARTRAEAIDRLVAAGRDPGPLAGVPIGLKDLIDQAGIVNTKGSDFPSEPSPSSATVVRRIGNAGGVIIGRTGLHEFAFGFTSENDWFDPIRNPWNTDHAPGGSSGGSAAAVAAGVVPLAIGTDTGGSVRVPAALCGVVGLKVTHGRIPLTGVFPLAPSLDTVGPIAANIDDLTVSYLAMAGDDPSDPWSKVVDVEEPNPNFDIRNLTVAIVNQWSDQRQEQLVADGVAASIERLAALGATIVEIDEPKLGSNEASARAFGAEVNMIHGENLANNPSRYGADIRKRIEEAAKVTAADLAEALRWRSGARAALDRLFSTDVDIVVAPTVGAMHKTIGEDNIDVDGDSLFHRPLLSSFTAPINQLGLPAVAAPAADSGSPGVSIQLVGQPWGEARLLAIAAAMEREGVIATDIPPIFFGKMS
ncbi:MAG: amidase [Acidimicrobiia bacterium]